MNKFLLLMLALVTFQAADAQDKKTLIDLGQFFKYSMFYSVGQISQPLQSSERFYYVDQDNAVIDETPNMKANYSYGLGIRKVARFDSQRKQGVFYDGTEQQQGIYTTVGAVSGWEYKFEYTQNRQFGNEFTNQDLYLRYLGKNWVAKLESKIGGVELEYNSIDLRWRKPIGKKLNLSVGAAARSHTPYGEPIRDYLETPFVDEFGVERLRQWWELAYEYGFQDNAYGIDIDFDGTVDYVDYYWEDSNGARIADTDQDFRANHYGPLVATPYNKEQLALIDDQGTLSAVIGLDFYHYEKNSWLHFSFSALPYHTQLFGDEEFGYALYNGGGDFTDYGWFDYQAGLVTGWKISKNLGIYIEGNYLKFLDRKVYETKAALNYQF